LPSPAPMVVLKVGFYLTDLQEPDSGQTYVVPGSHRSDMATPAVDEFPEAAAPICSRPGDAIMYDFRLIHSVRSPNLSTNTRRAVFIQYAYRWISPMNRMEVAHLADECSPLRLQLLGLSTTSMNIGGIAEKRSSRFYPLGDDLALRDGIRSPGRLRRIVNRARRFFRS